MPILIDERKRIEKAGGALADVRGTLRRLFGFITMGRVQGRVGGILGVSRSFGDPKFKRMGVISQPGRFVYLCTCTVCN